MSLESKQKWIETGYKHFANVGPDKLSINQISKDIGSSRASFYHFFGDIDIFIDELLAKHWQVCEQFNKVGEEQCNVLFPDLYELLSQYTTPLQFSLQLFHHRHSPRFNYIFIKTYSSSSRAFALKLFADSLDLNLDDKTLYNLWLTMGEAWYSRLDPNDLSAETMQRHAQKIIQTLSGFLNSKLYTSLQENSL